MILINMYYTIYMFFLFFLPIGPGLPRDEARFSSRLLGRNPPSGRPASYGKTPDRCRMVAQRDEILNNFLVTLRRENRLARQRAVTQDGN